MLLNGFAQEGCSALSEPGAVATGSPSCTKVLLFSDRNSMSKNTQSLPLPVLIPLRRRVDYILCAKALLNDDFVG
jgi:hypothetical protein